MKIAYLEVGRVLGLVLAAVFIFRDEPEPAAVAAWLCYSSICGWQSDCIGKNKEEA